MLELKNYTPINDDESSTIGIVSFYNVDDKQHLNLCRHVRKKNGGSFIAYPSKTIKKEGQDNKYIPYFCYDKDKNNRFQSEGLKLIEQWVETNKR